MINSPCRNCSKVNMPKEVCIKSCKKIQDIQQFHVKNDEDVFSYRIDYVEEAILGTNNYL